MEDNKLNDILSEIPDRNERMIVFDTETTGLNPLYNNIIEIGAIEILNGKITGKQFHMYIEPRYKIEKGAQNVHHYTQYDYEHYYKGIYHNTKESLFSFLQFVGASILIAHNAKFDIDFLNHELIHWDLPTFPLSQFRCSMILFKNIIMPHTYKQHYSLIACCNYFNLEYKDNHFHSALFDAFMTARMVLSLYDYISYLDNAGIEIIQKKKKETNDSSSTTSVTKNENEITDEDINELLRYF